MADTGKTEATGRTTQPEPLPMRVLCESVSFPMGDGETTVYSGSVTTDIPAASIPWLLANGSIETAVKAGDGSDSQGQEQL